MKLKYKFCNIFSEFSFDKLLERFFTGLFVLLMATPVVLLYTFIFSFSVSVTGSITIAILLCVVFTIIVLYLGSLLDT
ncbi:hypothetical protein FNP02_00880 [Campylobacter coli]|nr:hypothetical protein [Campylobacter coli]EDD2123819.1 hypothetical protein [Campylobacter coli]